MSNNQGESDRIGASERQFNIPPPPPIPPNLQPYGSGPYLQPSPSMNHGGVMVSSYVGPPSQFANTFPTPQNPMATDIRQNYFLSSFHTPPPTPHFISSSFSLHHLPPPPPPAPSQRVVEGGNSNTCDGNDADKTWISDWLQRIGKENKRSTNKEAYSGSVKISEMKEKVMRVRKLIKDLESRSKSLMIMMTSLDEAEWQIRVDEVEDKKRDLATLLEELSTSEDLIREVRRQLDKRTKKRRREKRKRVERKMADEERRIEREQEKVRIDGWMEEKREAVERVRRDEELKREADSVLSGVTKRSNEAKRQLALMERLRRLHCARLQAWTGMGIATSSSQLDTFNTVVGRLTEMWTDRLESYKLEEHGLKVMLHEAAVEDRTSSANRKKVILRQWESALFGSGTNAPNTIHLPRDFQSLLAVRKDWDKFVVDEGSVMSSTIPVGWIIPTNPSSDDWKKLLQHQNQ